VLSQDNKFSSGISIPAWIKYPPTRFKSPAVNAH
jgi:hypothetical protein